MSLISLQNSSELEVTILSNRFIDNFMPRANGEFVKVYIYLLRAVSSSPSSFSVSLCETHFHIMKSLNSDYTQRTHNVKSISSFLTTSLL